MGARDVASDGDGPSLRCGSPAGGGTGLREDPGAGPFCVRFGLSIRCLEGG